jgi:hypothetical protein
LSGQRVRLELLELHPGQQRVIDSAKRFNVLKIGRRFGKTTMAVNELLCEPMLAGFPVAYFAPTYKDLYEVWKDIKYTLHPVIASKDETVKQITLITGGKLDCWSMEDPDSGRGRKYKRVVIDEAEKAKKFQEAWERTIRSTLIDYQGDAWMLSTPKFGQTYFKELYRNNTKFDDWASFNLSSYDNPFNSKEELDALRLQLDDLTFRCEILAEDVDLAYQPFAYAFSEAKHVGTCQYNPGQRLYISFDFNVNPITAIAAQNYNDTWYILREFRMENSNIHALCDRIRATYPKALMLITGDASGAGRTAITDGVINYYTVIQQKLYVSDNQIHTPRVNPSHADSSVLFNSILQNYKVVYNGEECPYLIQDLKYVEMGADNSIAKKEAEKQGRGHLLDCNRYLWDTFMGDYLKGYL